jgi:hypothetical protein
MSKELTNPLRALPASVVTIAMLLLPTVAIAFIVARYDLRIMAVVVILLGVLALMFAKPEQATLIILFLLYTNLSVVAIRFYNIPQLAAASVFLLLGIPLSNYLISRQQRVITNRVLFVMLVYFVACVASALFSEDPMRSLDRIVIYSLEGVVLYFLFINTIRTSALLRKAIWTVILAGCLMGSVSLYQEATGSYDNVFGGFAQVKQSKMNVGVDEETGEKILRRRLAGPVGEKNRYAQVMVVLLPLALFRVWGERSQRLRIFAAASCIVIFAGVLLTFSRGAGVTIVMLLLLLVFLRYIKIQYFLVLLFAAILLVVVAVPGYMYRIATLSGVSAMLSGNTGGADSSMRGRVTENLGALYMFLDHPILGVGTGQSKFYAEQYGNKVGIKNIRGTRRAHNMYLEELADTGIIGFLAFMAIVGITLRELTRARRRWALSHAGFANIAASLWLSIIAYLGTALFLHLSYQRFYWLLLALAGAALQIFRTEGGIESEERSNPHDVQLA